MASNQCPVGETCSVSVTVHVGRDFSSDSFLLSAAYELKDRCRHGGWKKLILDGQGVEPFWLTAGHLGSSHWSASLTQPFCLMKRFVLGQEGFRVRSDFSEFVAHAEGLYYWDAKKSGVWGSLKGLFSQRQDALSFLTQFVDSEGRPATPPEGPFLAALWTGSSPSPARRWSNGWPGLAIISKP